MRSIQTVTQQDLRQSLQWLIAWAFAIGSILVTSHIGAPTSAFAADVRRDVHDSAESRNTGPVLRPSRHHVLIGLLENERRAIEQRIGSVEAKLGTLVHNGTRLENTIDGRRLDGLRQQLSELEQQQADLLGDLADTKVHVGDPVDAVSLPSGWLLRERAEVRAAGRREASLPAFIPAAKPHDSRSLLLPSEVLEPGAMRRQIQEALVFLGGYDSIIDGNFGPRTEKAIRVFQERLGVQRTGELSKWQVTELLNRASSLRQRYGLRQLTNNAVGYSLAYPSRLLPMDDHLSGGYRTLSSASRAESLQVIEADSRAFQTLFQDVAGHQGVSYSRLTNDWFVASGEVDEEMFYSMGRRAGDRSIIAYLTYPESERELWAPFTVLLYNSFRLTSSSRT
ncbi:MAG: peptidoglycan-binding domain-containing protein [Geminicoccaceae bacterium]